LVWQQPITLPILLSSVRVSVSVRVSRCAYLSREKGSTQKTSVAYLRRAGESAFASRPLKSTNRPNLKFIHPHAVLARLTGRGLAKAGLDADIFRRALGTSGPQASLSQRRSSPLACVAQDGRLRRAVHALRAGERLRERRVRRRRGVLRRRCAQWENSEQGKGHVWHIWR